MHAILHGLVNQLPVLIAYYQAGGNTIDTQAIRTYAEGRLSEYLNK